MHQSTGKDGKKSGNEAKGFQFICIV